MPNGFGAPLYTYPGMTPEQSRRYAIAQAILEQQARAGIDPTAANYNPYIDMSGDPDAGFGLTSNDAGFTAAANNAATAMGSLDATGNSALGYSAQGAGPLGQSSGVNAVGGLGN